MIDFSQLLIDVVFHFKLILKLIFVSHFSLTRFPTVGKCQLREVEVSRTTACRSIPTLRSSDVDLQRRCRWQHRRQRRHLKSKFSETPNRRQSSQRPFFSRNVFGRIVWTNWRWLCRNCWLKLRSSVASTLPICSNTTKELENDRRSKIQNESVAIKSSTIFSHNYRLSTWNVISEKQTYFSYFFCRLLGKIKIFVLFLSTRKKAVLCDFEM